jgi:hypothetical protein
LAIQRVKVGLLIGSMLVALWSPPGIAVLTAL